jgi:hypothetical protein
MNLLEAVTKQTSHTRRGKRIARTMRYKTKDKEGRRGQGEKNDDFRVF